MAEVYKVKTVGLAGFEKVQALKRILPTQAREPRFIRSFIDEARICVELSHRTIVQVFDFGEADGELYLTMELIEGKDLRTALVEAAACHLPLPATLAAYVIAEVATGLDYAHRKRDAQGAPLGIVHCDVSPANVMLSTEGYVKILDFGVARASFASAVERRRLRGKPRYMAPEQTYGERPTPATDVFALGIVAWELLTGAPLFDGPDLVSILAAVRRAEVPSVDRLAPDVPDALAAAVSAALAADPVARGSAADLAAAAAAATEGAGPRAMAAWLDELARRMSVAVRPAPAPAARVLLAPAREGEDSTIGRLARAAHDGAAAGSGTAELTGDTVDRVWSTARRPVDEDRSTTGHRPPMGADDRALRPHRPPIVEEEPSTTGHRAPSLADAPGRRSALLDDDGETATHVARMPRGLVQAFRELMSFDAGTGTDGPEVTRAEAPSFAWEGMDEEHSVLAVDIPLSIDVPLPADARLAPSSAPPSPTDPWSAEATTVALGHLEAIDEPPETSAPPVLVERRRAVVVAAVLDPSQSGDVTALAATLGELAYKRGGLVVADDPVVVFGLEVAGEDDAATAMAFALEAQLVAREAGVVLRLGGRAGVAIGGETRPRVPTDALDEARALARDAAPERPLFAGAAGRLSTSAFSLRERPAPRRLHRRLRVVEVLGPRSHDERGRLLERRGRFLGRTDELLALDAALADAMASGTRRCALIQGAAGAGKSRLAAELVARASARGAHLIAAGAGPGARLLPYALYTDLVDALLDLPPARGADARARARTRLERLLERTPAPGDAPSPLAPAEIARISDAWRTAMELRDGAAHLPVTAELRVRLAACLTAVARAERPGHPRVVVIEDLHLADTASVAVLRDWIFGAPDRGELVLATARPEHASFPADVTIELADLEGDELIALVTERLAEAATPTAINAVIARAGGNPLFVEELAAAVREAGAAEVPPTARDVIAARVARLPPAAKTVLQYAAVAGDGVRVRILEELTGAGDLASELEELAAEGLLIPADLAALGGAEDALAFARGLIREVVYDSLSQRARRDAHLRIGRLYASRFHQGREEPPSVVADHLERGGDGAAAAAFWLRAARLAAGARDWDAALSLWDRVLSLESRLGPDPPTASSSARRFEAHAGREAVLRDRLTR